MTTWLNPSIQMQFRVIDGLSVRFAESGDRDDHALLLSPWPESHYMLAVLDRPETIGQIIGIAT